MSRDCLGAHLQQRLLAVRAEQSQGALHHSGIGRSERETELAQLGSLALAREDLETAASELAAALGNGLDDSRIHYSLARTLRRAGKPEEAEKHLLLFRQRKAAEQAEAQP